LKKSRENVKLIDFFRNLVEIAEKAREFLSFLAGLAHLVPVEPKPPSPRSVEESSSASRNSAWRTGAITNWAIRSPDSTVAGMAEWL
jgi:hypothetical protein